MGEADLGMVCVEGDKGAAVSGGRKLSSTL